MRRASSVHVRGLGMARAYASPMSILVRSEGVEPPRPKGTGFWARHVYQFHHEHEKDSTNYSRGRGPTGDRTLHARLAKRRCAPALRPWSQRPDSNRFSPPYEGGARPDVLHWPGALGGIRTRH